MSDGNLNTKGSQTGRVSASGASEANIPKSEKPLRPIYQIAQAVADNWAACYSDKPQKPNFYIRAMPYLNAMHHLSTPATRYGMEYGGMIVAHFLNFATQWRGPFARSVKIELNEHLERYNNRKES